MNKSNNEIILENSKMINELCHNICNEKNHLEDFIQEIYIILLLLSNNLLNKLYNKRNNELKYYFIKIITNQWKSIQSTYYMKFRKKNNIDIYDYKIVNGIE